MSKKSRLATKSTQLTIEGDGNDIFVVLDGLRIAKRGHSGTLQAKTWVSIEPGWTVRDGPGYIEVEHEGVRVH